MFTTIIVDEAAPELKAILCFNVPDQNSGKLELQYFHDYTGICASVGLTTNPIVNVSGVVGTSIGSVGTDVSFDAKTGNFTKQRVNRSFSTNENTFTVGTQHSLDPLTTVKARVKNFGRASALIQHEWRPKSIFTLSGEVNTKAIDKSAKFGRARCHHAVGLISNAVAGVMTPESERGGRRWWPR
ncbi:mitochondrial outer membrane protein porin of 34 kDa [Tanacetum coccineum]